jgi:succinoglycan biosynthesis transport protein ExoP
MVARARLCVGWWQGRKSNFVASGATIVGMACRLLWQQVRDAQGKQENAGDEERGRCRAMLHLEKPPSISINGPELSGVEALWGRVDFVTGFLRRRYLIILVCLLLSAPFAALYLLITPPLFTASATMMMDARRGQLFQQSLLTDAPADSAWVDSQIGILKSKNVALNVVRQLRLAEDVEFIQPAPAPLDMALGPVYQRLGWAPDQPKSEAERAAQATGVVEGGLDIRRLGLGYLIKIDFRGRNPEQAVKIANAVVDAYVLDEMNSQYQTYRRGSDWLQDRLQTLREQTAAAERAVVEFKKTNHIVSAGGRLMSDQDLSDINSQLSSARARVADIQARLGRIETILRADEPDLTDEATVNDTLSNPIITKLRGQYLDFANRLADWSVKYGKNHQAVVNIRSQMKDLRRSIMDELGRIAETYKSEYVIAKRRLDEQEARLTAAVSQSRDASQAQIALNSLESSAQSYRKLYDNFLGLYTQSVQQQLFPVSEARLISPAAGALKSYPRNWLVWTFALLAGGMFGAGIGALREFMDRAFRTAEQVHSMLNLECMALAPLLVAKPRKRFRPQIAAGTTTTRRIRFDLEILSTVTNAPVSPFADALRSVKFATNRSRGMSSCKVVALTSSLPGEGKSTMAVGMAQIAARAGRTILVDCDLRNPFLSRALAPQASVGLLHVLLGRCPLDEAVCIDPRNDLTFLPAVAIPDLPVASEILTGDLMRNLFLDLKRNYDHVVLGLSPLVAWDVRATADLIDAYVLVIEWGRTKIDVVQKALRMRRAFRKMSSEPC